MSKNPKSNTSAPEKEKSVVFENVTEFEPRLLSEAVLHLWNTWEKEKSPRDFVPSHTPNAQYIFTNPLDQFPPAFPNLDGFKVPQVRDKGIKASIAILGEFFGCKSYHQNLLQFWFLDVITQCLWTAQDDFHLGIEQQKIVLAWFLYSIDLIRDPGRNVNRRKFFGIFKEAMLVAAEAIDEGCDSVPTPDKLFCLIEDDEENEEQSRFWSSDSAESETSSLNLSTEDDANNSASFVEFDLAETCLRFILPTKVAEDLRKYDLSSIQSSAESNSPEEEIISDVGLNGDKEEVVEEEVEKEETLEDVEFYQADPNIPSRFVPLFDEQLSMEGEANYEEEEGEEQRHVEITCTIKELPTAMMMEDPAENYDVQEVEAKFSVKRTHVSEDSNKTASLTSSSSSIVQGTNTVIDIIAPNPRLLEKYQDKQMLKALAVQKLWEQRLEDMDHPKKGWIPTRDEQNAENEEMPADQEANEEESEEEQGSDDENWADIIVQKQKNKIKMEEEKLIVNFAVLRAIISLTFKHFYQSFQFMLIKLAFQATPEIVTQKLNCDWRIPKKIKQDLVKPKVEKVKEKKEKQPKEPKEKKEKPAKEGKSKSDKKEKKEKPVKLTKEEKAALEKQRKEQLRLEEELRQIEENKKLLFPLDDAATDDLFKKMFENWVRVDFAAKKGKSGKGK